MNRILVTPRSLTSSPHRAVERLRTLGYEVVYSTPGKLPDEAELWRSTRGVVGWLAGVEPVSERVVAAAGELRAISRNGTGVDNLPLQALAARGVVVRTASGANALGVAELAIGLIFAALRHIPFTDKGVKAGQWPRRLGREIRGRTVGVVGMGAVGRETARLATALGAKVLAYDPAQPANLTGTAAVDWVDLAALLALRPRCDAPLSRAAGRPADDRRRPVRLDSGKAPFSSIPPAPRSSTTTLFLRRCNAGAWTSTQPTSSRGAAESLTLVEHDRRHRRQPCGRASHEESVERATVAAVAESLDALAPGR